MTANISARLIIPAGIRGSPELSPSAWLRNRSAGAGPISDCLSFTTSTYHCRSVDFRVDT